MGEYRLDRKTNRCMLKRSVFKYCEFNYFYQIYFNNWNGCFLLSKQLINFISFLERKVMDMQLFCNASEIIVTTTRLRQKLRQTCDNLEYHITNNSYQIFLFFSLPVNIIILIYYREMTESFTVTSYEIHIIIIRN